ncbi:DUF4868 domain-containing protein [Candidatus Saccharibacteria bacterium]|jgi:hypothetical protein|nr:DUF4868 domain-containing protein [Candidatus Saccharibacteria bacterium]
MDNNLLSSETTENTQEVTDIFQWANQTDAVKQELAMEVYLFNRYYTPFVLRYGTTLEIQLKAYFLLDPLGAIQMGAGTGLSINNYELSEAVENEIQTTELSKVENAQTLVNLIETQQNEIVEFSHEEHDIKRMKGILVRFSDKESRHKNVTYSVKLLQGSSALTNSNAWQIHGGKVDVPQAEAEVKIPNDNQVLIINKDIFIFKQNKFERMFGYSYKQQLIADKKIKELEAMYKLSYADEMNLAKLVNDKPGLATKINKLNIGDLSQEQVIEYADEMQLDLMTDDAGAIIIMDDKDAKMFINLVSEDYITSERTGKRYEIKGKKLLDAPDGEPPRG